MPLIVLVVLDCLRVVAGLGFLFAGSGLVLLFGARWLPVVDGISPALVVLLGAALCANTWPFWVLTLVLGAAVLVGERLNHARGRTCSGACGSPLRTCGGAACHW